MTTTILNKLDSVREKMGDARLLSFNNNAYICGISSTNRLIPIIDDDELTTSKEIRSNQTKYSLYSLNNVEEPIAECCISRSKLNEEQQHYYTKWGMKEVPEYFFYIDLLYVKAKHQQKGIGSFLLNTVITDLSNMCKEQDIPLNILFETIDTDQAKSFYKKWGAASNNYDTDKIEGYLIINDPKVKTKYKSKNVCPIKLAYANSKVFIEIEDISCERE